MTKAMLKLRNSNAVSPPYAFDGALVYDVDLAYIWFDDFKANASGSSANLTFSNNSGFIDYLILFENEEQKEAPYYTESDLQEMDEDGLIDLWEQHFGPLYGYGTGYPKNELIDGLLSVTLAQYYTEAYEARESRGDLEYDYRIFGHSQGDAVAVLDLSDSKYWGDERLQHVFFDTPLSGIIRVYENGEEIAGIYIDEFLKDAYAIWNDDDKDDLIEQIMKCYGCAPFARALYEYLTDTLPDDYQSIEYQG